MIWETYRVTHHPTQQFSISRYATSVVLGSTTQIQFLLCQSCHLGGGEGGKRRKRDKERRREREREGGMKERERGKGEEGREREKQIINYAFYCVYVWFITGNTDPVYPAKNRKTFSSFLGTLQYFILLDFLHIWKHISGILM
jgi:hypothetical protein